jgi:hypothetical protein
MIPVSMTVIMQLILIICEEEIQKWHFRRFDSTNKLIKFLLYLYMRINYMTEPVKSNICKSEDDEQNRLKHETEWNSIFSQLYRAFWLIQSFIAPTNAQ